MVNRYDDPEAFRQALLARLRNVAAQRGQSVQDLQLKVLIERLLARLFSMDDPPWVLKGGYAMELRYRPQARTTRDIDLTAIVAMNTDGTDPFAEVLERLREAAEKDLGDHLVFRIGALRQELPGAPLGGGRFPVEARLAGRVLGRFHIDVGFGDPFTGTLDELVGDDVLAFAGIPPARARAVSKVQQFAEKIHAYTFPWVGRENTRVKDLVDLVLLIERGALDRHETTAAIRETFERRGTHPFPDSIPAPPQSWEREFSALARDIGLQAAALEQAFQSVQWFLARD